MGLKQSSFFALIELASHTQTQSRRAKTHAQAHNILYNFKSILKTSYIKRLGHRRVS